MASVLIFLSLFTIVATALPLLKVDHYSVRLFDFPRFQIVILSLLVLIGFMFFFDPASTWHYALMAGQVICMIYQLTKIYPYTRLARKQVLRYKGKEVDRQFSIIISNVLTPNRRVGDLIRLVNEKQPCMLLTLESDSWWEEQLSPLEKDYPYTVKIPLDNLYGMHLYSKLELEDTQVKYLVQDKIPSIHTWVKLPSGHKIKLYCLHPMPPTPTESETSTNRDAELLLVGKEVQRENNSVIVTGDLNDVAWSRTTCLFLKISGLLDPRIGRGFFNTYHARFPLWRWPLDHIFHTSDFTLISIQQLPYIGSDHFPIYASLFYEPKAEYIQEEPVAEDDEKEWAEEKIEKAAPIGKVLSAQVTAKPNGEEIKSLG